MDMTMSRRNATAAPGTILILSSQDLQTVMRFDDYVDAVAEAFRMLAEGRCESPVPLQVNVTDGTFHAKAASLPVGSGYVAVKVNGNFPDNRSRHGLPTIQGVVFLADANNGRAFAGITPSRFNRAIYNDGWLAATPPPQPPWDLRNSSGRSPPSWL
jgi:hypothetical protein